MWGGKKAQEVGDICTHAADSHCCKQKPTRRCKAILLHLKQLKKKETAKREDEKQCEMGWETGVKKEFQRTE